ncbi:MAG TPA: Dabb family protein [Acidimicrobiales bacterium]|jgi:hypothetical protein|nr:Dabb family protein [Acidimicrobiales bacterium]
MIRHVVMWTFLEQAQGRSRAENLKIMQEKLEALPPRVPGIRRFEVGVDQLAGPAAAHLVLVSDLDDWAALDAYRVHPAHQEVVQFLDGVRDGRWTVDYEY